MIKLGLAVAMRLKEILSGVMTSAHAEAKL
jgi:hypothetical protein